MHEPQPTLNSGSHWLRVHPLRVAHSPYVLWTDGTAEVVMDGEVASSRGTTVRRYLAD